MEKTSINEQGGDVNHMTGIPLFTVRLFKRRIRDCPNIEIGKIAECMNIYGGCYIYSSSTSLTSVFVVPSRFRELFF